MEILLDIRRPIDSFVCQPDINHIHCKNRWVEPLWPIFITQLFYIRNFLVAPIVPINLATCSVVVLYCDWLWDGQLNHVSLCIWGRFLLPPLHSSVQTLFLHQSTSKNELPPFSIHPKKSPNTGFILSTILFKNPLISFWFCYPMLDRYAIGNFHVAVLITPMKRSQLFYNSLAASTNAKYESVETILSMLAYGSTSSFRKFLPWDR